MGARLQAALAKTYLHMMDPSSNELSKEIKETREEVRGDPEAQRSVLASRRCRWAQSCMRDVKKSTLTAYFLRPSCVPKAPGA